VFFFISFKNFASKQTSHPSRIHMSPPTRPVARPWTRCSG